MFVSDKQFVKTSNEVYEWLNPHSLEGFLFREINE